MDYVLIFAYYTNTMGMSRLKIYLKFEIKIRIILNSRETIVLSTILTWDDSCMAHNQNPATEQNIMQWKQRENLAQQKVHVCNCILEITVTLFWWCEGLLYLEFMPSTFTNDYQAYVIIIMILNSLAIKIVTKIDNSAAFKKKSSANKSKFWLLCKTQLTDRL